MTLEQFLKKAFEPVRNLSRDGTAARELEWYVESLENHGTVVAVFCRPGSCSPPMTAQFVVE